jgi:hypothetical protein
MVTTRSNLRALNAIVAETKKTSNASDRGNSRANPKKNSEGTVDRRITRSCSRNQQQQQEQVQVQAQAQENAIKKSKSKSGKPTVQETVQQNSPEKLSRDERRRNEALMELKNLGKVSSLIVSGHRRRNQTEHRDAAFVLASLKQSNDVGMKGGLVRGSRHHYERSY